MTSSGHLKPGEKGEINISVDVRGKLGKISKTVQVYSNDPKRPQITLMLTMKVKDVLHAKTYNADEIFKKQCSRCHVDVGKENKGIALFNADCAMCHNYGKTASPVDVMQNMSEDKLRQAIEKGVDSSSMPGWAETKGGPLTKEEIDLLVEFIKGHK